MTAPLAWVRRITSELPQTDSIPLFGNTPPFDWDRLSSSIAALFGLSRFSVRAAEQKWRTEETVKEGLGTRFLAIPVQATPLEGTLIWMMSREDIIKLTSWMMKPEAKTKALSSEVLQEGFYRYLVLEALNAVQAADPLQGLTLHLGEEGEVHAETAFCIDIEITFDSRSCWGRLVIPQAFRRSWVQHYSKASDDYTPSETARLTQLVIGIKTGSVCLHLSEWKKLKKGDFVVLDRGSYDLETETGAATLMLGTTPLFNVKIQRNKIELTDYAFYHEDNEDNMEHKPPEPEMDPAENLESAGEDVVAIKDMPLTVTVELARLKITLDQLMHLNPGNMLELPIHPDQGVSLTIQGQKVGRAELVYLGETLGIRVLEIG